ncbi:response regulator [Propionivibrio limicola]|uniref:response regulator n=1 Tax=Propionivibrio limicola TaxID=167645 RepID=UPI00129106E1|nr:response regulator [Propionivibrio limicola]
MSIFTQIRSILGKTDEAPPPADRLPDEPVERRHRKRLSHKGRRILIIDDSPTIVAALRKMLQSAGCITFEALTAEKGLEIVETEKPDLVFLDIVLPGMNGFAALRLIRRNPATGDTPIIMISGNEQATEQFYAKRIGANDFMKKPFSRHEVFARIEQLVLNNTLTRLSTLPGSVTRAPAAPAAVQEVAASFLEARRQLTAMGLQYYSQEQYLAAIERGDTLAADLFVAGGGIKPVGQTTAPSA